MCGIAAVVAKRLRVPSALGRLDQMLDSLSSRGPDERGVVQTQGIDLGMVRLSIVDIKGGQQPLWNENHTAVLVCNGEIYNAPELRKTLTARGHRFESQSDVEVILHLYEDKGPQCVFDLQGTFAFMIWDITRQLLFAGRDRVGVKPLYFAEQKDHWSFASDYTAVAAVLKDPLVLHDEAVQQYYRARYSCREHTVDARITRVLPGHTITVSDGAIRQTPYWVVPRVVERYIEERSDQAASHLLSLMQSTIRRQDAHEVRSAVLLSGGLDSTAILALRHSLDSSRSDTAITIAFEEPLQRVASNEYSELHIASRVAQRFEASHKTQIVSAAQALDAFPSIVRSLGEPIGDPTAIPLWFACQLARSEGCKVVYSGEGMDELFGGYAVYGQATWLQALQWVPASVRQHLGNWLQRQNWRGHGLLHRSLATLDQWYHGVGGHEDFVTNGNMRKSSDNAKIHTDFSNEVWRLVRQRAVSPLQQMLLYDLLTWLPDNTLAKSDRISMAHSVELRVPFLDERIVDFAMSSPDPYKRKLRGKPIVRRALRGVVPEYVRNRRKVGFAVPVSAWIYGEWNAYVKSMLLDPDAITREWFSDLLPTLFAASPRQQESAGRLLYTLLTFEVWYRNQVPATSCIYSDQLAGVLARG
ncbi:MAG: asparagine synthase (glutamine-hydrolyzing) [Firmicutes bacterium]|nr:asparagine synthase (glutamine-hydrolyzing) [Bacillota bacterium]